KRYEEETNLRCYILLDVSSSMRYTSDPKYLPKIEYASYLSAALSLLMLGQRDGSGLISFSDKIETFLPPSVKPSHQRLLLKTLSEISSMDKINTVARQTDSGRALSQIAERIQKRSLIILISDLWDNPENVITALKFFRHRHNEVIVFHLIDPQEHLFDFNADAEMVDMETGNRILTSPRQMRQAYEQAFNALSEHYKQTLTDNLIDYNLVDTSKPFDLALFAYLKKRSRLK
ncbi:MAG: VWA domain-containing protein, partial [Chlorobiales bacterium]|nr:VWA domain-containing protein [Chlorobiales bacterium]